jgi:predicted nuclease of predicted toxin-antitoxin system
MKFLVDAHLPRTLCALFRAAGHDAIHTSELPDGNRTADAVINDVSVRQGYAVISKDTDFYYSHLLTHRPHKLVLVRTGNIGVRDLRALFQQHLPAIIHALETSSLVELNRSEILIIT